MLDASKSERQQGDLYEKDFYAWTQEQADLLRHHQWHQLDTSNLIEEIESLGKQQRQELRNRLSVLIQHLLKWEYQPRKRTRSWLNTIRVQRLDITDLLNDNPSLAPRMDEILGAAYRRGIELAIGETDLVRQAFPRECPYSITEILDNHFFPGDNSQWTRADE